MIEGITMNTIHPMDCIEGIRKMADESVDLIITSPPYNIGKMHSNHKQFGTYAGNDMKEQEYQKWQKEVLSECFRVLKPDGSFFYNHKVRIKQGKAIHPLEWVLDTSFILKQEITWDMGKSANCDKIRFFPFSERIYWLTKSSKTKLSNDLKLSDVWRVVPTHKRRDTGHIAVMPEQIVDNILDSIQGHVVLDPFAGSGTTMALAARRGRQYVGFEIDPEYVTISNERIAEETAK